MPRDSMDTNEYKQYATAHAKPSPIWQNTLRAFLVGGGICTLAQGLKALYQFCGLTKEEAGTVVSITLIFLAALFTGLGLFDRLARFAGAGTLVPITGFANAMAAPAVDTKGEGFILGVGAKLFTIAGPVIVYGTAAGVLYGVIYWLCTAVV